MEGVVYEHIFGMLFYRYHILLYTQINTYCYTDNDHLVNGVHFLCIAIDLSLDHCNNNRLHSVMVCVVHLLFHIIVCYSINYTTIKSFKTHSKLQCNEN